MPELLKHDAGNMTFHVTKGSTYPFSTAVETNGAVYLSGQIGVGANGLVTGFEAQSRQLMDNVAATLADLGLTMSDLVKVTIYLKDIQKWPEFNKVYVEYFTSGRFPARTAIGVDQLVFGAEVELDCIAAQRP
jgi:reactive intermediate/imine deaminase